MAWGQCAFWNASVNLFPWSQVGFAASSAVYRLWPLLFPEQLFIIKILTMLWLQAYRAPTFSPRSSSLRERFISLVRMFMRSHSWKATTTYGVLSSTFAISSAMLNSSISFSSISSRRAFTCVPEGEERGMLVNGQRGFLNWQLSEHGMKTPSASCCLQKQSVSAALGIAPFKELAPSY